MPGPSLIDRFAVLEDPRQSWKVLFLLPEVPSCLPSFRFGDGDGRGSATVRAGLPDGRVMASG